MSSVSQAIENDISMDETTRCVSNLNISDDFETIISSFLICSICHEQCDIPVAITDKCEHYYCLKCAMDYLQSRLEVQTKYNHTNDKIESKLVVNMTCAMCRTKCTDDPIQYPLEPPLLVSSLHMAMRKGKKLICPSKGCNQEYNGYRELFKHYKECLLRYIKCPLCDRETFFEQFDLHIETECKALKCSHCWRTGSYNDITMCMKTHHIISDMIAEFDDSCEELRHMFNTNQNLGNRDILHLLQSVRNVLSQIDEQFVGVRENPNIDGLPHLVPINIRRAYATTANPFMQAATLYNTDNYTGTANMF